MKNLWAINAQWVFILTSSSSSSKQLTSIYRVCRVVESLILTSGRDIPLQSRRAKVYKSHRMVSVVQTYRPAESTILCSPYSGRIACHSCGRYSALIADPDLVRRLCRRARSGSALTVLSPRPWACWSHPADDRESAGNEMRGCPSRRTCSAWTLVACSDGSATWIYAWRRARFNDFARKRFPFEQFMFEFSKCARFPESPKSQHTWFYYTISYISMFPIWIP